MTINLYLVTRPLKDGTCNVVFYLTNGRDFRKMIPTGVRVEKKYWDKKKQRVKATYNNHKILNHSLDEFGLKVRTAQDKFHTKQYTEREVVLFLEGKTNFDSVDDYIETEIKNSRKSSTYIDYRNAINSLKLYTGFKGRKIRFEDVNYSLLDMFKREAEKNGVAGTSFNSYLTKIRAVFNDAYNKGFIYEKFEIHKNLKATVKRKKVRTCTFTDFENAIKRVKTIYDWQALAFYLLMFNTRGMYPADIVNFKMSNFEEIRNFDKFCSQEKHYLTHRRSKTNNRGNEDMIIQIVDSTYRILTVLKRSVMHTHKGERYKSIIADFNDNLAIFNYSVDEDYKLHCNVWDVYKKKVTKLLGFSFKTARKTFNTFALELSVSDTIRRVLLGHNDNSMLLHYDNLNTEKVKKQVQEAHMMVLKEFKVDEIVELLMKKIKEINVPEIIYSGTIYIAESESGRKKDYMRDYEKCLKKITR